VYYGTLLLGTAGGTTIEPQVGKVGSEGATPDL
jgi:hypothetical protein